MISNNLWFITRYWVFAETIWHPLRKWGKFQSPNNSIICLLSSSWLLNSHHRFWDIKCQYERNSCYITSSTSFTQFYFQISDFILLPPICFSNYKKNSIPQCHLLSDTISILLYYKTSSSKKTSDKNVNALTLCLAIPTHPKQDSIVLLQTNKQILS